MVARWTRKRRATSAPLRPAASIPESRSFGVPRASDVVRPFGRARGPPSTGAGSLSDHGALELGEGPKHLHHHASGRTGGVDRLCQGRKVAPAASIFSRIAQQILERA